MIPAAQQWPDAAKRLHELARTGQLSDKQRQNAEWLGFELPAYQPRTDYGLYQPSPKPATSPEDLACLVAGGCGPATAEQVYELPTWLPLRHANDNPDRSYSPKHYVLWAQGRGWYLVGHPFSKYASLSERTAANAARRVANEQKRVKKATQAAELPPLTALFYGQAEPVAPRYTTAEQANAYELKRRSEWLTHMRNVSAKSIREARRRLAQQDEATLARWFTEWQRRGYGSFEYLLDFIWQKQKGGSVA